MGWDGLGAGIVVGWSQGWDWDGVGTGMELGWVWGKVVVGLEYDWDIIVVGL